MKLPNTGSISKNLAFLVILAVLPALAILLYTGLEQRRHSIENAKRDVLLLAHTMAEVQKNIATSTSQLLSTLSLLPAIQRLDVEASREIFLAVLEQNPDYTNITLTDPNGDVLISGQPFSTTNLGDRKHVRDAIATKDFAVGEYIVTRVGKTRSAFPFAYPVLNKKGELIAVLTTTFKLARFSRLHESSILPEKSFVAVTDHRGVRLFYYPPKEDTNPVGKRIKAKAWQIASQADKPGVFMAAGSDGSRRIFAFEQILLSPEASPYLYVWAAMPEDYILGPANAALTRNLILMFLVTAMSFFLAWLIGKRTFISPIQRLITLTQSFAAGKFKARCQIADAPGEFGTLSRAFHDMAAALSLSQKELQENEARFRLLMDSMDALIYVADMKTYEILFINEYGRKKFGDLTGKICWQTLQQDQSGPCPFCSNKYLLNGDGQPTGIYTSESQNTVTGTWFHIHDRAINWVDGRVVRFEFATDISDRKLAETRLAEEKERLAVTLRSIGDGVITTDTEGQVLLINKVAESLTGWENNEAVGRPLPEVFAIINAITKQSSHSPLEQVMKSGKIIDFPGHMVLIAKNGKERTIAASGAPIKDKEGQIIGLVLVFRNVTDQLRTEEELLKVKKLESIGVLAGGIAHDFNNILSAILGNIDLSLLDANLSPKTETLLSEARKASYRARDLTHQLLTFAKGGDPIKQPASLVDIIKDAADFVLQDKRISWRYQFPDDLWFTDIDKGQIGQVVQNLFLNASNAMPQGGVIEVSCENMRSGSERNHTLFTGGDYVKMSITDHGVGIPANILDKIFDPYFSTKQQGSGLGLAISHSIISKHGGHISATSSPDAGTTFTVYLPAAAPNSTAAHTVEQTTLRPRKSRILIMDDEEQVRFITQAMLEHMGHEVLLAQDGEEAIKLYKETLATDCPIDIIIMDLTIPGGMGGKEAVQEILAINPNAKVIVSSGYSNDPVMANFEEYGFCAAIAKPFQLTNLTQVINQLLV